MSNRAILFDLDGTIADTPLLIQKTFEIVLKKNHIIANNDTIKKTIGKPLKESFLLLLDEEDHRKADDLCNQFRKTFSRELKAVNKRLIFEDFFRLAAILKKNNIKSAIVTSKIKKSAYEILNISQTDSFFAGVFCHDMVKNGKPSPDLVNLALRDLDLDKSQVIVVGDSTSDIEMANKAKVNSIGVTWGVSMNLDFSRVNCTNIAESWEDLTIQLSNFFMHTTGGWNGHYTTD